jgi:preprotein translocase subunit SecG
METILRILQVFLALGLIGVVLLQRSEGGGLGIGSSGGMGSFMSVRGTANFLTRVTAILAALFMTTCLALTLMAKPAQAPRSIFDTPAPVPASSAPAAPTPVPAAPEAAPAPAASAPPADKAPPVSAPEASPPAAAAPPPAEAPAQAPAPAAAPAPSTKPAAASAKHKKAPSSGGQ